MSGDISCRCVILWLQIETAYWYTIWYLQLFILNNIRFIGWQLEVRRDSTSNGIDVKSLNILAKRNYILSIGGGEITCVHPIHVMGNTHNQESGTCKCMHKSSQLYENIQGWLCSIHAHKHTRIHIHTHRRKRIHTFLACGTLEQSSINSVTNSIPFRLTETYPRLLLPQYNFDIKGIMRRSLHILKR